MQIIDIGPLRSGQSTITFLIINITDTLPLPAVAVVLAFQAANPQGIDTYPVGFDMYILLKCFYIVDICSCL